MTFDDVDYERLALEMLSVEAGNAAEVKDAMRKIIASAPEGADLAFLLSRALAHAGDRSDLPPTARVCLTTGSLGRTLRIASEAANTVPG